MTGLLGNLRGGRWGTRTPDPKLRRLVLYPPELIALFFDIGRPFYGKTAEVSEDRGPNLLYRRNYFILKPEKIQ